MCHNPRQSQGVGDSPEEAWRIYQEAQSVLLREAEVALEEGSVIG